MRWKWTLVGAYAAALLVSHALHRPDTAPFRLAYRDVASTPSAVPQTPLLLIHGSPGDGGVFRGLARLLGNERRLLIPDLPGFGSSSGNVPGYSFRSHARWLLDLLDKLDVRRVHVLGFSMGGGVALEMARQEPARVMSLTMVSALGVQEMELLGQYQLNHVAHGVQLGAMWVLRSFLPIGGVFEGAWAYARNFYDSDQRPLRGVLLRFEAPMLIVHGRRDPRVPVEAAIEHSRLVPQAELVVVDADHFMAFQDPARLAPTVQRFLGRVDAGEAVRREEATATRIRAAAVPFDERTVPRARAVTAGVLACLITLAAAVCGSWAQVGAGVLVAQGRSSLVLAAAAVAAGTAVGARRRLPAALPAALATVFFTSLAAPPLLDRLVGWAAWPRLLATTAIIAPLLWLAAAASTYRRRRLLVSSWRRLTRWEYWPIWAAYLPVAAYVGWLMVKHRSLTVFTAANPAIQGGGVVGESKITIIRGLACFADHVAASMLIEADTPTDTRLSRTAAFRRDRELTLPLVLKPDAGQRGSGVVVARTEGELVRALASIQEDTVVQEYVGGEEFGVFYCRRPSEPRGRILSMTRKQLPAVRGDGVRTLERLILDDERAVCMARFHLTQQRARVRDVPAAGEMVSLGDCGSHCRGAVFLDGAPLITPALEEAIDRVATAFPGFYFGRFDLRAPSAGALVEGRRFKILELNGVTSEPTHIYDPAVSLGAAYRALFEQWRLAFEIGAENAGRGAVVTSAAGLIRLAWRYRRTARHRR